MAPTLNQQFGALPTFAAESAAAEKPAVDVRVVARDAMARFLGQPTGNAQSAVQELTDVEAAEVADAAADRHTARQAIKGVLSRAYDRRRVAAQREAGEKGEFLRRRGLAQRVLEQALHLNVADAADVARKLSPDDQRRLADLSGLEDDVADQARAILDEAEAAAAQESGTRNPEPDEPTDVIPGGSTPLVSPEMVAAAAATDEPPAVELSQAAESDEPAPAAEQAPPPPDSPAKGKRRKPVA